MGREQGCFYFSGRYLLFHHDDTSNAVFFRSPKAARSPHVTLQTVMFPDIAKQCDTNTSAPLYYVTVPSCFSTQVDETLVINAQQLSQIHNCSAEPCCPLSTCPAFPTSQVCMLCINILQTDKKMQKNNVEFFFFFFFVIASDDGFIHVQST